MSIHAPQSRFTGLVAGAYAASPTHAKWNPLIEAEFLEGLAATPDIGALEIPWLGRIHPHDVDWMHRDFPSTLGAVVTGIPFVMGRIAAAPGYGLASLDEEGRRAAIVDARQMLEDVRAFDDAQGRSVVGVVELHSAPRGARGGADALAASLAEIAGWEWGDIDLVVEHCDAWRDDRPVGKGFLELQAELDAIEASGTGVGVSLNWGRSAIEGRSAETVVAHAEAAAARGLLRGFIASGAAGTDNDFGAPWVDAHLPFAPSEAITHGTAGSLMTEAAIADVARAAGPLEWTGVKVGCARADASVADRVALVAEAIAVVKRAFAGDTR